MVNRIKRVLCLSLVLMLVFALFAGCGGGGSSGGASPGAATDAGSAPANTGAVSGGETEEPYTVTVMIPNGTGKSLADELLIEEAVNAITVPESNIKLDLLMVGFGQYTDQLSLMLASGSEKLDLFMGMGVLTDLGYMASTGQIVPIEDEIAEYGKGITDALGDYYKAGMNSDGHIYSVAGIRDMAYSNGLLMRKDVLDAAGIDIDDIDSFEDIGEMCAAVKESGHTGAILGLMNNLYYYDGLGNNLGVIMDIDSSLTVENLFETDEFEYYVRTVRDWYLAGYMYPEADTSTDNSETQCKNGLIAGYVMSNKPGMAAQETANTGHEMVATTWGDTITTTTQVNFVTWQVAYNSENVAAAVKMLNYMYSSPEVANLINYGIEDKHYEKNADGTVGYPEGVDDGSTGWTFATGWMLGNQFIQYVWEGNPTELWEQMDAFNKSATLPLAFGFTPNFDAVATEVAACSAVYDQYYEALMTGSLDPDVALKEFNDKLYASGLQKIIDEKQTQLDAWAAANGVTAG